MNVDPMDHQIPSSKRTTRSVTTRMTRSKSKSPSRFHSSASPTTSTMKLQQNTSISNIKTSIMEPKSILNDELLVPFTIFNESQAPTSDVGDTAIITLAINGGLLNVNDAKTKMNEGINESDSDLSSISSNLSGLDVSIPVTSKCASSLDEIPQIRSKRARVRVDLDNPMLLQSDKKLIKKKNNLKSQRSAMSKLLPVPTTEDGQVVTPTVISVRNNSDSSGISKRSVGRPRKDERQKTDQLTGTAFRGGVPLPMNRIINPVPTGALAVPIESFQSNLDGMKILNGDLASKEQAVNAEVSSITGTESSKSSLLVRKSELDLKRNMHRRHTITLKPPRIQSQNMRPVLANLRSPSPMTSPQDMDGLKGTGDSDNHCSSCLLGGYLVCCETCPRVFHVGCMNPPLSKVPDGVWECAQCRPRQESFSKLFDNSIDNKTGESIKIVEPLWKALFDTMNKTNPRIFELPRSLREMFEGVLTHPHSGAYLDATEREIREEDVRMRRKDKRQRFVGMVDQTNHKGIIPGDSEFHICYRCRKTEMKSLSSQFHSSTVEPLTHSGETLVFSDFIQSNMIKCDFCDLYWHYDCLDPPLANAPPRNLEKVDLNLVRELRKTSWGNAGVNDWEWDDFINVGQTPKRRGFDDMTSTGFEDEKKVSRNLPAPTSFNPGIVFIRRKWMCPCHADWLRPKRRKKKTWGWIEVEEGVETPPMLMPSSIIFDNVRLDNVYTITSHNLDLAAEVADLLPPVDDGEDSVVNGHLASRNSNKFYASNAGPSSNDNLHSNLERHQSMNHDDIKHQCQNPTDNNRNLLTRNTPPSSINSSNHYNQDDTIKLTEEAKMNLDRVSISTGDALSDLETLSDVETSDDDSLPKPPPPARIQPQTKKRGRPSKSRDALPVVGSRMAKLKPLAARVNIEHPSKFVVRIIHRDVMRPINDSKNDGDIKAAGNNNAPTPIPNNPKIAPIKPLVTASPLFSIKESLMVPAEMKIELEPEVELYRVKHRIPATRLKMDFLEKCRSLRS